MKRKVPPILYYYVSAQITVPILILYALVLGIIIGAAYFHNERILSASGSPSLSMSASPSSVYVNGTSTISWAEQNVASSSPLPWSDTGAHMPAQFFDGQAVVLNDGYVYIFDANTYPYGGGQSSGSTLIYRAPVADPTNWTSTGANLPLDRSRASFVMPGDGYMYLFGGDDGFLNPTNSIMRASTTDPLHWTVLSQTLPRAVDSNRQLAIVGEYIYLFGSSFSDYSILRAPLSNPTAWVDTGADMTFSMSFSGMATVPGDGYVYMLTPRFSWPDFTDVLYRAPVSNPLSWSGPVATVLHSMSPEEGSAIFYPGDGYVYVVASPGVYRAAVSNLLSWSFMGTPAPAFYFGSSGPFMTVGGYEYKLGSDSHFNYPNGEILRSSGLDFCSVSGPGISLASTTGSAVTPPLTATTTYAIACGSYSTSTTVGILPEISLTASPNTVQSGASSTLTWSAQNIIPKGPLVWSDTGVTTPAPIEYAAVAMPADDYIYLLGGMSDASGSGGHATSTMYRASLSNPTAWVDTGATLPIALGQSGFFIANDGYMYLVGGATHTGSVSNPDVVTNKILRAPLSNPTVWVDTGSRLPTSTEPWGHVAIIGDYVYIFGGGTKPPVDMSANDTGKILRASLSNPTAWVDTGATLPIGRRLGTVAVLNDGYVYLFGGYHNGMGTSSVYRAPTSNPLAWSDTGVRALGGTVAFFQPGNGYLYLVNNQVNVASENNPLSWGYASGSSAYLYAYIFGASATIGGYAYIFSAYDHVHYRGPIVRSSVVEASLSGPTIALRGSNGSQATGALTSTATFLFSALMPGGIMATKNVVVTVIPPPPAIQSFSATRAQSGNPSTLSFTINSMTSGISCAIAPALPAGNPVWSGINPWSSTATTAPISMPTAFTLLCGNGVASTSASATAGITPSVKEI